MIYKKKTVCDQICLLYEIRGTFVCFVDLIIAFVCLCDLKSEKQKDQTLLHDIYSPLWTYRHPLIHMIYRQPFESQKLNKTTKLKF